jgi:hypothetical protein
MSERRYTQDEVSAIFERASETERTLPASAEGAGLTLAELHDIARQVGMSPESVSLAAQSLDQPAAPAAAKIFGISLGVARTVELDHKLSDSDWEALVADLRTTFQARGRLRIDGPFRQWTNGNLSALVEPTPNGHRLRLQSLKEDARSLILGGTVLAGVAALVTIVFVFARGHSAAPSGASAMVGAGLAMVLFGVWRASGWARIRAAQFEEIIARVTSSRDKPERTLGAGRMPDLP